MIKIDVLSDERAWSKKIRKKIFFFNNLCKFFPKKYQYLNKEVSLTLLLSNNKGIKKLNKNFRNKNKSTDILSFPFNNKVKIGKKTYLGDIIISYNYMNKPRTQKLKNFQDKAIKTFIHGFLHLLNFDHIKNKDYKNMLREEDRIYKSIISKKD
jgi:probable rRNA maturation factor